MKKILTEAVLLQGGGADNMDVRYLTRFSAPDPFIALRRGRTTHMVLSPLEIGRARKTAVASKIYSPDQLSIPAAIRNKTTAHIKALLKHTGTTSVRVSATYPASIVSALRKSRIKVMIQTEPLFPDRARKKPDELVCMQEAQRAAVRAMKRAFQVLKESTVHTQQCLRWQGRILSSERLRTEIQIQLLRDGYGGAEPIVAGGDQATDPHEIGFGPLHAHQPIILDIFPRSSRHGYWGDITRTVIKGYPSSEQKKLYQTVLSAQKKALVQVRAGVQAQDIHQTVCAYFKHKGYETNTRGKQPSGFFHGTGHGVGLEIHESPSVSLRAVKLEAGHVITIEPGLYYPGLGGVRIEDTVVVRKNGFDFLAICPKTFVIP